MLTFALFRALPVPNIHVGRSDAVHAAMFTFGRAAGPTASLPQAVATEPSVFYTVAPGDTITRIAEVHAVDPRQLASLNGIRNPDRIFPGQVLQIPHAKTEVYTVVRGDTLGKIARQFGVSVEDLARVNAIPNPDVVQAGAKLVIPKDISSADIWVATSARASTSGMIWPVTGAITSSFGYRWGRLHTGIDIAAAYGQPVQACLDGIVSFAGRRGNYGNLIILDHGKDVTSYYGHLSRIETEVGSFVKRGEQIGRIGSTGTSTGPHLHFEVRIHGEPQNPRVYLP